jgi:hypothetical protein
MPASLTSLPSDSAPLADTPAAVCALRESDSMNNLLLMPHYTGTVIYQERITSAVCEPVDQDYAAA